jgi:hypothetical protein
MSDKLRVFYCDIRQRDIYAPIIFASCQHIAPRSQTWTPNCKVTFDTNTGELTSIERVNNPPERMRDGCCHKTVTVRCADCPFAKSS